MALPISLKFPAIPPSLPSKTTTTTPFLSVRSQHRLRPLAVTTTRGINMSLTVKAVEESQENAESEAVGTQAAPTDVSAPENPPTDESSAQLGAEIREAMKQRKEERGGDLLSGVLEEIREIEWPAFSKVLGTTGVVLGVIAGSSVVLLTVNAVLAELSDQVFAGKGVQDFFS